jgi:hypothetical protein
MNLKNNNASLNFPKIIQKYFLKNRITRFLLHRIMNNKLLTAAIAALLVGAVGVLSGTAQQALADKVGPKPDEDKVKQGAMGEYFSKDGREAYGGEDPPTGEEFGQSVQNFARPGDQDFGHEDFGLDNLGENFAFYASGECHDDDDVCE